MSSGQDTASSWSLGPRGTLPMPPPASPLSITRLTDPLESPASGARARLTEPDNVVCHCPTLPFVSAAPEPREPSYSEPALLGLPLRSMSAEDERRGRVRVLAFGMAWASLFLPVTLPIALSLFPASPAPLLVASTSMVSSDATVMLSSAATAEAPSAEPALPLPPTAAPAVHSSSAPRPRAPARPPLPPRRPSPRSEIVNPWGG